MNQDPLPTSLSDDAIKKAARSAWGNSAASPDLRQRVHMSLTRTILEEPSIPQSTRSRRFWDSWPPALRLTAGIAALLLISLGSTLAILDYQSHPHYARQIPTFTNPAPTPSLFALLVARHDDFSAGSESPDDSVPPTTQLTSLRDSLATQLHHPIWAPDLSKLGWQLTSFRIYPINGSTLAAFHYTRGNASLTAFSLPIATESDACASTPLDLDQTLDNRSLSTFSDEGQLFGLVASDLPSPDLHTLLTQFRNNSTSTASCH
jgi:hypothetical protein